MLTTEVRSNPNQLLEYLEQLEEQISSSDVDEFFQAQPPRVLNEYIILRGDLSLLVDRLRLQELSDIAERIDTHTKELVARSEELEAEIESLASARKTLTRMNKLVSLVSRIALVFI